MRSLRQKWNGFLLRNRDRGIPRLMLWLGLANFTVYLFYIIGTTVANGSVFSNAAMNLYSWLYFDATLILRGQVWRVLTFALTYLTETTAAYGLFGILLAAISVCFYHWLGQVLEQAWGTLRLNIYYLSGILIPALAGILMELIFPSYGTYFSGYISASYVNISLFIAVATLIPDQQVLLFGFIPIRMRFLALVDLALTTLQVYNGIMSAASLGAAGNMKLFLVALLYAQFPMLGLANYFLHFGRNVSRLFRGGNAAHHRPQRPPVQSVPNPGTDARGTQRSYRHKCTVCGRTDTDCPDLEFRYCSKCRGYFCYCIDHISNHTHIT